MLWSRYAQRAEANGKSHKFSLGNEASEGRQLRRGEIFPCDKLENFLYYVLKRKVVILRLINYCYSRRYLGPLSVSLTFDTHTSISNALKTIKTLLMSNHCIPITITQYGMV